MLQEAAKEEVCEMESVVVEQGGSSFMGIVWLAVAVLSIVGGWKVFAKANRPGWAILIPIYNAIVMLQVAQKPVWWFILMLVPVVNIVIAFIVCIAVAKNFGKGAGFGVGLALLSPIFMIILGFGSAQYQVGPPPVPAAE
jgi:hypothetical protein